MFTDYLATLGVDDFLLSDNNELNSSSKTCSLIKEIILNALKAICMCINLSVDIIQLIFQFN